MAANSTHPGWHVQSDWADATAGRMHFYGHALLQELSLEGGLLHGQSFWYHTADDVFWAHGDLRYQRGDMFVTARGARGSLRNARLRIESTQARLKTDPG